MNREKIEQYDTFVTNDGSINERVNRATSLPDKGALLEQMRIKPRRVAVDIMVPNPCNQGCIDCYYREAGRHPDVPLDNRAMDRLKEMSKKLAEIDREVFFFYPREITTALPILELYPEYGVDRVLSNGKLLHVPGVLDRIRQAGIKTMNITFPGSRESFMEYTQEPAESYDRLLANIRLAVNSGLAVSTFMPIYKTNVDEVLPTVLQAVELGVKHIDFIRMKPLGNGQELPGELFIFDEDVLRFLRNLNEARHLTKDAIHLSLFRGSWGPNFYNKSIFRYLSGQEWVYPKSRYFCPMIDQQYLGVQMGSNNVYGCFQGVSFEEFEIGTFSEHGLEIKKELASSEWLHQNLRGMCSAQNCPEHDLCLGGCRVNAFSWAKRRGESEPMAAGQDFCITNFLGNLRRRTRKR